MSQKPELNLSKEEIASIAERLKSRRLDDADFDLLLKILQFVTTLRTLIEVRRFNILKLLRSLFGLKTEKKDGSARDHIGKNPKSGNTAPLKKGRNGKDDYPGAKRIVCKHAFLKEGDSCPDCYKGRLNEAESAVAYAWDGAPPLRLTIYQLERLLCNICKTSFTAVPPPDAAIKTVDDSHDDHKTARCDGNARANATVAGLRYEYGVPGYRLAKIQGRLGLALPESTQWRMISQVKASAEVIYEELIHEAATGELLMNDDTKMKVLDVIKSLKNPEHEKKPSDKKKKGQRTTTRTTTIVAKASDKTIVLYFTGTANAGENLARILDERPPGLPPPIQMCDGLRDNAPGRDYELIEGNCLTHGRRGFFDLYNAGQMSLEYVIDLFAKIYATDAEAKAEELSPAERLALHQKQSKQYADQLASWMKQQIDEKIVEPNSTLGKHIAYCQKRWEKMTLFLRVEGAPLSNDENERANKPIACYRKNSLFYKTENGAETGDILQSIMQTCNQNDINSFEYLTALQENRAKVLASPHDWLPWSYTNQISAK